MYALMYAKLRTVLNSV